MPLTRRKGCSRPVTAPLQVTDGLTGIPEDGLDKPRAQCRVGRESTVCRLCCLCCLHVYLYLIRSQGTGRLKWGTRVWNWLHNEGMRWDKMGHEAVGFVDEI
jgi:hypothetical protein